MVSQRLVIFLTNIQISSFKECNNIFKTILKEYQYLVSNEQKYQHFTKMYENHS